MELNPKEELQNIRKPLSKSEPPMVKKVREQAKDEYVCPYCKASRRVDVIYRDDLSSYNETVIEFECRAYTKDPKTGLMEVCGNIETRYYS